ncbi:MULTISPECIES: ABC transporter permease [unclassified Thermotoga]|uniref:ABC transporter permease n=1 Tax=unclassified Thermotoga TaxID=2631113 RepID=UPI000280EA5A|nr:MULTISPECIES: ABC transporter permease [unclassified Thermotoga]AIY87253.1 peptide ABC transporter permease [Thermotoga sp. 2812B]EJX25340.1 peptide ABC transporter permease [Thermotoga sp. EMP]
MQVLKDLLRDTRFRFGFIVFLVLLTLSILSFFSPYDSSQWSQAPKNLPPQWPHILGTNALGQDVFWRLTFAVKNSFTMAFIAGFVSRMIAFTIGTIAGYKGRVVDRILMFFTDCLIVIPLLIIIILVATLVKGQLSLPMLGLLLGVFGWAWDARVIRSQVLSLRERDFTYTALLSGSKALSIVFKEYLPFLIPLIFATLIGNMSWAIGMEITLGVLGLSNLEIPTLGTMLSWALKFQALFLGYWWWVLTPVLTSIFLFIALYLISISISEYLDPRMRIQRIGQA